MSIRADNVFFMSRVQLEQELKELERRRAVIESELAQRSLSDSYKWGFVKDGVSHTFNSLQSAIEAAVNLFANENVLKNVVKIYE